MTAPLANLLDSTDSAIFELPTTAPGPAGALPLTEDLLRESPSGDLFGMTQSAGMGWDPAQLLRKHEPVPQTAIDSLGLAIRQFDEYEPFTHGTVAYNGWSRV